MLMKEFPQGVLLNEIQERLSHKLQKNIDFNAFGLNCALEFV